MTYKPPNYTQHGHKLRLFRSGGAQFMVAGRHNASRSNVTLADNVTSTRNVIEGYSKAWQICGQSGGVVQPD